MADEYIKVEAWYFYSILKYQLEIYESAHLSKEEKLFEYAQTLAGFISHLAEQNDSEQLNCLNEKSIEIFSLLRSDFLVTGPYKTAQLHRIYSYIIDCIVINGGKTNAAIEGLSRVLPINYYALEKIYKRRRNIRRGSKDGFFSPRPPEEILNVFSKNLETLETLDFYDEDTTSAFQKFLAHHKSSA